MNRYNHTVNLNHNIFRAYDIRGIAFEDLTEEVVIKLGKALGSESIERGIKEFIIGRDGRNSSPQIFEWLSSGLLSTGCNVIDIGLVTSPMFYHATHYLNASSGTIITGSHNPKEYNGFKIIFNKVPTTSQEISNLKKRIEAENFLFGEGKIEKKDVKDSYIKKIKENINIKNKLNISIDCGNGAAGIVAKEVYESLGCTVTELYGKIDGSFPNHHPDPSKIENLSDLIDSVIKEKSCIGLAFDGDADRVGVISPAGNLVDPDMQMILFSRKVINENPGCKIVYDVKCSQLLSNEINNLNGEAIISRTGHTFIKQKIRETGAKLGGEMSGHIFFNDRWAGFDDGIYAGARLLEIIDESKDEDIFENLPNMISTPEINIAVSDSEKFQIVENFMRKADFINATIIDIDGIRVEFENGWGLLRASNTTPALVLRFEAQTEKVLKEIKEIFKQNLKKIKHDAPDF